ncbi:MAG: AraC family transcriptional regulator [Desulfitobacteriia bacterium]|jgi:AraC-like DNA-binding protein
MVEFNVAINGTQIPIQPELQFGMEYYYQRVKEWNITNHNAAVFYQFKIKGNKPKTVNVIPDGCIDILFRCDQTNPDAVFFGRRTKPRKIILQPGIEYFGFRPFSDKGIRKLNYSLLELLDQKERLNEVVPNSRIIEEICNPKPFNCRIDEFQNFANNYLIDHSYSPDYTELCEQEICLFKGAINIEMVSQKLCYSSRYLRKKFKEAFGISPKKYGQILKFQNVLHMLVDPKNNRLLDVAFESGYYDHSHFIREFKNLTNITPSEYKSKILAKF